eukprot:Anaeramoba_flamelloidesc29609_g1_i1.p1 GENE.c29609_g1_i1~~c29609_g1_i1.p1  ORF type:complete len:465 (+),score=114.42 c29609_g1_i1:1037-2431(+)
MLVPKKRFWKPPINTLSPAIKKLIGFESSKGGFEWFGGDPGHEALTSMGIMQFTDMKKVWNKVDQGMIDRTTKWLLDRRNKETGGFDLNSKALDSFGRAPQHTTDAYIVWALTKAGIGYGELEKQILKLENDAKEDEKFKNDSYFIALIGLILWNVGFIDRSLFYAQKLKSFLQEEDGQVIRPISSVTNSGGNNLAVETTAIACLLWIEHNMLAQAKKTIQFIATKNQGGKFGSTQATVLALMALIKWDEATTKVKQDGKVIYYYNEKPIETVEVQLGFKDTILFKDISASLQPAENVHLQIQMIGGSEMTFSISMKGRVHRLDNSENCNVSLETKLLAQNGQIKEGEATEIQVKLKNKLEKKGLGMVVAIVGLPGGLQPRFKKLQELKKSGVVASFELFGPREVVFYWRCMKPEQEIDFTFDVLAEIPGKYFSPPSRAYVYYDDEQKFWNDPFEIDIIPKIKN